MRAMPEMAALAATLLGLIALGGCASGAERPVTGSATRTARVEVEAYPSTYRPAAGPPVAITGVTLFDGTGGRLDNASIVLAGGTIRAVGGSDLAPPADMEIIDGRGKFVTPGIIDVHSHLGVYPAPSVDASQDGNEATDPTTPELRAEHSVWPQDPGFSRARINGGVTTLQILPGSANVIGGRTVVLKNVPAITVQGMKMPDAPYGLKMACGENPKRVYGGKGRMPSTRMGSIAVSRALWLKAKAYRDRRASGGTQTRDLALETMADVLDGRILAHQHCYRADEMAQIIDLAKEFGFRITAFHHAVEAYKIADLLRDNDICAAVWADWWGFKLEANDAIAENAATLHAKGACTVIHSDDRNQIQRLNQEAAKALADGRRMGLTIDDAEAIVWITGNAAKMLGIAGQTGSLVAGKAADVVLWNGNPLSVYSRPEKVWIDGVLVHDASVARVPASDFELGLPGAGDVK